MAFHLCIQQTYRGWEGLRKASPQCCRTVNTNKQKLKQKQSKALQPLFISGWKQLSAYLKFIGSYYKLGFPIFQKKKPF